jgi:hypothetical protein
MELKFFFALIGVIAGTGASLFYIVDVLRGKTRPHLFTWIIWSIAVGTVAAGVWYGGGGFGVLGPIAGFLTTLCVAVLSLKYGTKNITIHDTIALCTALGAILVWWQLQQPLLAVLMVTVIDLLGYIPTFRKSFHEPWSENVFIWSLWIFSTACYIASLAAYNPLTLAYPLITGIIANVFLILMLATRRRTIPRPSVK